MKSRKGEASNAGGMRDARWSQAWRSETVCGLLMVACVISAWPFAEMGFDDDWSYAKTAEIFAQSGHFVYNGWATAMLGWQIWWGALFIKLLGFSFAAVRLSTLILALIAVILFHRILLRAGISRRNAVFGTLTLALSPLFLVLTASYMSDIPGLLIVLLCLYCCLRATEADRSSVCAAWLAAAAMSNVAGGTARQIAWLGALVMVPSTAWVLRRRRGVLAAGMGLWVVSAAGIYLCIRWFQSQPYSISQHLLSNAMHVGIPAYVLTKPLRVLLCLLLVALPILSAWLQELRKWRRGWQWMLAAGLFAALVFWIRSPQDDGMTGWLMPWLPDIIGSLGSAKKGFMLGVKPAAVGLWPRAIVSMVVIAAGISLLADLSNRLPNLRKGRGEAGDRNNDRFIPLQTGVEWQSLLWITVPFSLCYAGLILLEGTAHFLLDRYLLELLAVSILLLLRYYQDFIASRLPAVCWGVLAIFTFYSVAGLHDIFALQRARVKAGEMLVAAGVPRTQITGGFEYDGWTQIEAGGYVHDPLIRTPAEASRPRMKASDLPAECTPPLYPLMPAIEPKYYVVFSPLPCLKPSVFGGVQYGAWMPPFRREIYIEER